MSVTTTSGASSSTRDDQLVERSGDARHDEVVLGSDETGNCLADEVAVVGDDDADRHSVQYRSAEAAYSSTQSVATVASVAFTPPAANAAWAVDASGWRAKSTVTVSASLGAPTAAAASAIRRGGAA